MRKAVLILIIVGLSPLACNLGLLAEESAQVMDTSTSIDTPVPTATDKGIPWPSGEGECTLTTTGPTAFYDRPNSDASVFFEDSGGMTQQVTGRTADGWVGFNPAIAQAANMGPFRLRWVFYEDVELSGDCLGVEEVWAPLPGFCYEMPMETAPVYSEPLTSATLVTTLEVNQFAAITGLYGSDWAQVDLGPGNTGLAGMGWIQAGALNMNGASCASLPAVVP
jgi:hypothetical protein